MESTGESFGFVLKDLLRDRRLSAKALSGLLGAHLSRKVSPDAVEGWLNESDAAPHVMKTPYLDAICAVLSEHLDAQAPFRWRAILVLAKNTERAVVNRINMDIGCLHRDDKHSDLIQFARPALLRFNKQRVVHPGSERVLVKSPRKWRSQLRKLLRTIWATLRINVVCEIIFGYVVDRDDARLTKRTTGYGRAFCENLLVGKHPRRKI